MMTIGKPHRGVALAQKHHLPNPSFTFSQQMQDALSDDYAVSCSPFRTDLGSPLPAWFDNIFL